MLGSGKHVHCPDVWKTPVFPGNENFGWEIDIHMIDVDVIVRHEKLGASKVDRKILITLIKINCYKWSYWGFYGSRGFTSVE